MPQFDRAPSDDEKRRAALDEVKAYAAEAQLKENDMAARRAVAEYLGRELLAMLERTMKAGEPFTVEELLSFVRS